MLQALIILLALEDPSASNGIHSPSMLAGAIEGKAARFGPDPALLYARANPETSWERFVRMHIDFFKEMSRYEHSGARNGAEAAISLFNNGCNSLHIVYNNVQLIRAGYVAPNNGIDRPPSHEVIVFSRDAFLKWGLMQSSLRNIVWHERKARYYEHLVSYYSARLSEGDQSVYPLPELAAPLAKERQSLIEDHWKEYGKNVYLVEIPRGLRQTGSNSK